MGFPSIVVVGVTPVVSHHDDTAADGSIFDARSIAPAGLTEPAPCVSASYSAPSSSCTFNAVNCSRALAAFGVRGGAPANAIRFASITSASVPLTTPAAMLVPLNRMHESSTCKSGLFK